MFTKKISQEKVDEIRSALEINIALALPPELCPKVSRIITSAYGVL